VPEKENNKDMSIRLFLFSIAILSISVPAANAGPANRRAATASQPSVPVNLDGFGAPLAGVAQNGPDLNVFATGQINFKSIETLPQVGPVMNGLSCAGCHSQPAIGGGGLFINEIRVRNNTQPGPVHIFAVDNCLRSGAQTQGKTAIFPQGIESEPIGCQITAPGCQLSPCQLEERAKTTFSTDLGTCDPTSANFLRGDNCVVGRAALALFGDGLVEAVSDQTFEQIAANEPPEIQGTVKMVTENLTDVAHVGRFGWKDDHASLRGFSGDAYLNEMGITNPDNQDEVSQCAMGEKDYGIQLEDTGVEDPTDSGGRSDIDRFSDFMRALSPPPPLPRSASAQNGSKLFISMGCTGCHTQSMRTDPNPASFIPASTGGVPISQTLNKTLANQTFHPYSDFLVHDMGSLGDGITSGTAGPTMMRTAPLWGLRAKSQLLHDGRAADIASAIKLHDGQGAAAAKAFGALSAQQNSDLVNFLNTL
jgi:hypothetical protein